MTDAADSAEGTASPSAPPADAPTHGDAGPGVADPHAITAPWRPSDGPLSRNGFSVRQADGSSVWVFGEGEAPAADPDAAPTPEVIWRAADRGYWASQEVDYDAAASGDVDARRVLEAKAEAIAGEAWTEMRDTLAEHGGDAGTELLIAQAGLDSAMEAGLMPSTTWQAFADTGIASDPAFAAWAADAYRAISDAEGSPIKYEGPSLAQTNPEALQAAEEAATAALDSGRLEAPGQVLDLMRQADPRATADLLRSWGSDENIRANIAEAQREAVRMLALNPSLRDKAAKLAPEAINHPRFLELLCRVGRSRNGYEPKAPKGAKPMAFDTNSYDALIREKLDAADRGDRGAYNEAVRKLQAMEARDPLRGEPIGGTLGNEQNARKF